MDKNDKNIDDELSDISFFGFEDNSSEKKEKSNNIKDYDKDIAHFKLDDKELLDDEKPFFDETDILDIIDTKRSFIPPSLNDKKVESSNLIKKNDKKAQNAYEPSEFKTKYSKNYGISQSEWAEIANDLENNNFLNDDFHDFIELPKISGDEKSIIGSKLIPSDKIESSNKMVEIGNAANDFDSNHSTSIEINRNEKGDIDSITVYCKCGEITNIKFDYDENNINDEIEFYKSTSNIEPLELPHISTHKKL